MGIVLTAIGWNPMKIGKIVLTMLPAKFLKRGTEPEFGLLHFEFPTKVKFSRTTPNGLLRITTTILHRKKLLKKNLFLLWTQAIPKYSNTLLKFFEHFEKWDLSFLKLPFWITHLRIL